MTDSSSVNKVLIENIPYPALIIHTPSKEILMANCMAVSQGAVKGKTCYETFANRISPCPFCKADDMWAGCTEQRLETDELGSDRDAYWVPLPDNTYLHYVKNRAGCRVNRHEDMDKWDTIIHDIGLTAKSCLNLEMVLHAILKSTLEAVNATVGMLLVKNSRTGLLCWGASIGLSKEFVEEFKHRHIKPGDGLTGRIFQDGKSIYIREDSSHDPRIKREVTRKEGLNSFIGVPVYADSEIIGVMNVLTRPPDILEETYTGLVTSIGAHIGSSVRNALLFEETKFTESMLHDVAEKVSVNTGENFFHALVHYLALETGTDYALVGEYNTAENSITTIALYAEGEIADNISYRLNNSPCDNIVGKEVVIYPRNIKQLFPEDKLLFEMDIESYAASPLLASDGSPLGLIALLGKKPIRKINNEIVLSLLNIFSGRAAAELERRHLEDMILESEQKYRTLIESANDAIFIADAETGHLIDANRAAERLMGIPIHELIGMHQSDLHPRDERFKYRDLFNDCVNKKRGIVKETFILSRQGHKVPVEISSNVFKLGDRFIIQGIFRDITENKLAEAKLRNREKQFRSMFESNPHPMWVHSIETLSFLDVNRAAIAHYGYSRDEFLSMNVKEIHPIEDVPALINKISKIASGFDKTEGSWIHVKKDRTVITVEMTSHTVEFNGKRSVVVLSNDITERNALEKNMLEIEYQERQRLGFELHDGLGQLLAGISYKIHGLDEQLRENNRNEESRTTEEIISLLTESQKRVSRLSKGLSPIEVNKEGLVKALESLAFYTSSTFEIECSFECNSPSPVINKTAITQLYRIVQEAVTNAVKHSRSTQIRITLTRLRNKVSLKIRDNGTGIRRLNRDSKGIGLKTMKHRAGIIHASFDISRIESGGTLVSCTFSDDNRDKGQVVLAPKKQKQFKP